MTDSSVFAHVVLRNNAPEPTATLALEYLLGHEDALFKFAELWPEEIREKVKPRRVESETTHGDEDARPDLSIYDDSNTCRVLVENKFWAGLTPHQPVKYLEELPTNGAGALLLFIVPKDRSVHGLARTQTALRRGESTERTTCAGPIGDIAEWSNPRDHKLASRT
ncbi:MAG: hypothetical protein OXH09_01115 [Gammaproteobacteria bacterium]|nr:hypothetical protein [Gammaproteobacteria bacterium]